MSDNEKRPYAQVMHVASGLVEQLRPACHRIEIAGSLRRKRPMVGDIEIVAIPRMDVDLFGTPLDTTELDHLLAQCPVDIHKNGKKYKQFTYFAPLGYTYKADLFLQPDPATWGVNFLLRTGSADFSRRMVTSKAYGGLKPNDLEVRDGRVWDDGHALHTPEEIYIFEYWGMTYLEPENRV
ncbi:MAG: hypothetical protein IT328_23005 [Caldilineaceae bacterium]|nr:hypothetical protein [Caldilineaceae bacterium]